MDVYQDDIITQEDPKPKPALAEEHRAKLDSIVQQMIKNKESDDNINMVVNDFKQKYGQVQPVQQQPKTVSIGLQQPNNYQIQISQPAFKSAPDQTGEKAFTNQASTPELKFQQNALKAHDIIQNELKGNKDIKADMIKQRRFEQAALNVPISKTDMPKTQAEADVQRLIPQAQKPQELPVTEEDLAKEDADVMTDRGKAVRLLEETMKKYPEKAKELQKNIYRIDAANSLQPGQENRLPKIEENAKRIDKGQLVYDARSGRLLRPMGLLDSAIEGWKQDAKNVADYDFLQGANNNDILNEYHNRQKEVDIDKPIPVPKGKLSEVAQMIGGMPLKPLAAGAIGSLGGPEAGGAAATLVGGRENQKREYAGTFWQTLDELIKKGTPENEAVDKARELAGKAGQIGALTGAAMGLTGARMADLPFAKPALSNSFKQAAFNVLKQSGSTLGKAGLEGLTVGGIGAAGQYYKNKLAQEAGIFRPLDQGLADQLEGGLMMTVAMAAAIKAGRGISKGNYQNLLHGLSKMQDEQIGGMLQDKVQNGEITQKAADETQQRINDYKAKDAQIPPNVTEDARFKIQDNIDKLNELEKQKEATHKSLQEPIKEKIQKLTDENLALSKETEKPIKPESGLTKDQEKEATEIAEEWLHEGIIPDSYEGAIKKDPIGFWKFLSQQAHNTDENWRPNEGPSPEQGMREDLGDTVVDYAKELFPAPKKETPSSVSVIQPGAIKHPETVTIGGKPRIQPESENIIPNNEFQTMGMGNDEGKDETKEARTLMKQRMLQGDIPIDGEGGKGETGRGFAGRVISAWENLKKAGGNNTTLVTHSSVLKAIKAWENPETWRGVEKPSDPTQMNNDQWLKFADEYNKESTENGDLETFKGDNGDIHVIRHGQTEDNKMNKFRSGNTNLTDEGIQQAHDVGKRLQEKTGGNVPQIVSSDLPRAIHTSNIIHENLKPTDHAISIGEPATVSLDVSSGSSQEVGPRVSESGETTNAQGQQGASQEGEGAGKEKVEPQKDDLPFKDEEGDDIVTSIKNATTRQKIEEYGLTPALQEARRTHQEVWDSALKKIAKGFDTQSLVDQLKKKPRPLTDEEDALLLIHQIQKEAAYDAVNKEINEAAEIGDYGTWEEAHLRRTALKDDLQDIYDIGKKVGTLNARGLSARQMIADRRYSLVNMEEEYRAAQRGEPLTTDQKADIERIHNEIRKAKEAYEARIKQLEGENEKLRQQAIEKKIQREAKKERIQKNIEKVKKDLSDNLDELRKIARNQGLGANPIALEAIPVIAKATKNLAKLGIVKIEQMAVHIYDALKDDYGKDKDGNYNLTVDHVMEAIEAAHNQQRLDAYKKGINKNIDALTEKLNQENVPNKPTKRPIVLDDQAIKLKAQEERLKAQYEEKVKKAELKNRTPFQKVQDTFVKWQRAFKLSHVTTLGKLSAAGLTRLITSPTEEAIGGIWSKLAPGVAKHAEGEAGFNVKAEAQAITAAFTKGIKDAAQTLKLGTKGGKGKSDLDLLFGKKDALPPEAIDFFGQLHSALKAPVKRAAFERSFKKRWAYNQKYGVDVSDPLVQARIATEAYKDGQRAIFMQDNFVSDSYRNWVNSLERSQKYPTAGKIAATTFQWMVPFVKVPTNIVGEVGTHVAGVPIGAAKLIHATFTKGLENLAPEEADMIMRNLKKGSVGIAALLMGYFNPNNFGGYYQKNEKRGENEPAAGEAKIFGHTIPKWLLHAPIYETMQLGATIRRVKDKMVHGEPQGLSEGMWAGALGLAEEEPLIDQPMRIAKIFENKYQRDKYFGELAKGTFDPGLLQDIAKWTDPKEKRKPEGVVESIEMGIPGLRENVGETSANGGGAGAGGSYGKPTRTKPEHPHKTHK